MKTVLLGDSLTAWHDWQECLGPNLNHALPGETTEDLLYRLERSLSAAPERVILMIGTNDLLQRTPLESIKHNYTRLLAELIEIEALYIVSVPPVADTPHATEINADIIALNDWLKEQLWKYGFTYVDLHAEMTGEDYAIVPGLTVDGVHFSDAGYTLFERLLKAALDETL